MGSAAACEAVHTTEHTESSLDLLAQPETRPRNRPYNSYIYFVPDLVSQQRLVDLGCHPRARKRATEYGGLHVSYRDQEMRRAFHRLPLDVRRRTDANHVRLQSFGEEDPVSDAEEWKNLVAKTTNAAKGVSNSEWNAYIGKIGDDGYPENIHFYDPWNRPVDFNGVESATGRGNAPIRGIAFLGESDTGVKNPLEKYIGMPAHFHFSLYDARPDGQGFTAEIALKIWRVLCEAHWHFILSTEAELGEEFPHRSCEEDRVRRSMEGVNTTYEFQWRVARPIAP